MSQNYFHFYSIMYKPIEICVTQPKWRNKKKKTDEMNWFHVDFETKCQPLNQKVLQYSRRVAGASKWMS